MELNIIYNQDCLIGMQEIPSKSIDCIICDLPYGTTYTKWDVCLPLDELWQHYNRIIKRNGAILLFGQEPFSSYIRISNVKDYRYDWYWQKEYITNVFHQKRRPGKTVETISVFYKEQCTYNPHLIQRRTNKRGGSGYTENESIFIASSRCARIKTYQDNGSRYPTQVLSFSRDYNDKFYSVSNITQKPTKLIEYLITTYTNEGEIVLDNCMGSGTTAIAAMRTKRNFIGFEKNEEMHKIAMDRISQYKDNTSTVFDLTSFM